jgi:hypothetical protein
MAFNAEQRRFWRELNRDAIREYQRKWRALNVLPKEPRKLKTVEEKRETKRRYYQAHKEEFAARGRKWRADPRNAVKEARAARIRYHQKGFRP